MGVMRGDTEYGPQEAHDRVTGARDGSLRATMDAMLDPHVVFSAVRDESGGIVDFLYADANAAACAYNRLSRRDLVGSRLLHRLPGVRAAGLFAAYCRVVETGEPLVLDGVTYESRSYDGEQPYYDIRGARVGDGLAITWREVTDRHHASESLRAQRDLAVALGAAGDLSEALRLVVQAALGLDGVDAVGVYLLDPESGDLRLAAHAGLSPEFIARVSHIDAAAKPARLVRVGESLFVSRRDLLQEPGTRFEVEEGVRSLAALPVRHEGMVVGLVNVASRSIDQFTRQQSSLLETLAAQVGGALIRLRGEAELRRELAWLRARLAAVDAAEPSAGRA
jgi:putative methionine-R-sulfoxide reductase with GAF domain